MSCTHCHAGVPAVARFCPRCGHETGPTSRSPRAAGGPPQVGTATRAPGAHPSTAPIPLAGIVFLVAAVLGPTMIAVGVSTAMPLLLLAGVAVALVLIALLLLGMVC